MFNIQIDPRSWQSFFSCLALAVWLRFSSIILSLVANCSSVLLGIFSLRVQFPSLCSASVVGVCRHSRCRHRVSWGAQPVGGRDTNQGLLGYSCWLLFSLLLLPKKLCLVTAQTEHPLERLTDRDSHAAYNFLHPSPSTNILYGPVKP